MNNKPKMKTWKKGVIVSTIVLIVFVVLANIFMDKYKMGVDAYERKDYDKAYLYLKQVGPNDKNYRDAKDKAIVSKAKIDSLKMVEVNEEKIKKQQELAEELDKMKAEKAKLDEENAKKKSKFNVNISVLDNRESKIEDQFSSWDGSHKNLTKYIKDSMNDPDSYEHIETKYFDMTDHLIIISKFRGTNSFGSKVVNSIKAKVDLEGNILQIIE